MADYCSYSHWVAAVKDDLRENNGEIPCIQCDGSGDIECSCCHDSWSTCEECSGFGVILFNTMSYRKQEQYKPAFH